MRKSLTLVALFVPLLASCSSAYSADLSKYQSQQVKWIKCDKTYLVPEDQQGESFNAQTARCGTLKVPATYEQSSDYVDFSIAMLKLPATSSNKLGTLFINPGGPGQSGVDEAQWIDIPKEVRARYDIIGFDPRGVNRSQPISGNPIKCSDRLDFETYWLTEGTPSSDAEVKANNEIIDEYYEQCAMANPSWWTLGTRNVAHDLELMRQVITGDQDLNFLGSSYGTTIAATYITMFPEQSGRITFDSPTTNENQSDEDAVIEAKALEAKVMRYVDGYAKENGKTREQVQQLLLKIRQWGDDDKLTGFAGMKLAGSSGFRVSTEGAFTHGILALTYWDDASAQEYFNQGIDELLSPNRYNGLFEYLGFSLDGYNPESLLGDRYTPSNIVRNNSFEIMDMVNSIDRDARYQRSDEESEALRKKLEKASPFWTALNSDATKFTWRDEREGSYWSWLAFDEKSIPDPPAQMPARTNSSGKSFLVIGSKKESITPYEFSVRTAKDLKSPLVTFEGSEHAPLAGFKHSCLNEVFVRYMLSGSLPTQGVSCPAD